MKQEVAMSGVGGGDVGFVFSISANRYGVAGFTLDNLQGKTTIRFDFAGGVMSGSSLYLRNNDGTQTEQIMRPLQTGVDIPLPINRMIESGLHYMSARIDTTNYADVLITIK